MRRPTFVTVLGLVASLVGCIEGGEAREQEGTNTAALDNSSGCQCDPNTDPNHCMWAADTSYPEYGDWITFGVPPGCTTVLVKGWAGGGDSNGYTGTYTYGHGGGGGFASALIHVTPGEQLSVHVAASSGGATEIMRTDDSVVIIVGGGGNNALVYNGGTMGRAGAGGGLKGQDATPTTYQTTTSTGGKGGTQVAGGAGGNPGGGVGSNPRPPYIVAGGYSSFLSTGGTGYAGGGGGGVSTGVCGPGGGASSYVTPNAVATSNVGGVYEVAGNPNDPDRTRTSPCGAQTAPHCLEAGAGGNPISGEEYGVGGRVVIRWGVDTGPNDFPTDPNTPVVGFSAATYSVTEGTATATITVKRLSGDVTIPFTVAYATSDGTAIAGADYTATSGTLSFAANVSSMTFTVPITNDTIVESGETVNLALSNPGLGAQLGTPAAAVLTINDNDAGGAIGFSPAAYTVTEGNLVGGVPAVTMATLTLARTGGTASGVTVQYATADGTATAGADYTATSGTATFAAGATTTTIQIPVLGDTLAEGNETFTVVLSNPTGGGALAAATTATVTIKEDETAPVLQLSSPVYSVVEGVGTVTVTVVRTGTATGTVGVSYATSDGSAITGLDYTGKTGTVSLGPNVLSAAIAIAVTKDTIDEQTEDFHIALGSPTGGAVIGTTPSATVQITDDDAGGALAFSAATYAVAEKNTGAVNATITVSRTGGVASGVTINYATSDGTAVAGTDYVATSGTLTFAAAATSATFLVPIIPNTVDNPNRTINLTLSSPTGGATLGAISTSVLTITDDDAGGVLAFSAATYKITEGDSGTANLTVTVSRTSGIASGVTVDYATSDRTAIAGADYIATSGTLSFAAGATSATFTVPIVGDLISEGNETFQVALSNPTGGATLGTIVSSVVTIADNEKAFTLSSPSYAVTEGTATVTITVTRSGSTAAAASVKYATSNGTAIAGSDYTAKALTTLSFAAGVASATFTVAITNDTLVEGPETFNVALSAPSTGYALGDNPSAVVTITSND